MASRRARVKVVPKLLPGRNRSVAQPPPTKVPALAAKESIKNPTVSQLGQDPSVDDPRPTTSIKAPVLETPCPPVSSTPLLATSLAEPLVTTPTPLLATTPSTLLATTPSTLLATTSTPLLATTSPAVATLVPPAPTGTKATPEATSSLSLVPLTTTTSTTSREAPNSDWEDDEFTYNSVEVSSIPAELTSLINQSVEVAMVRDNNENSTPVTATVATSSPSGKLRLGLGKNKFKPNLFTDRRARHTSGPRPAVLSPRPRPVSGSGTDSETEAPASPARRKAPLLESLLQPAPARVRRTTETRGEKERSQFMRRKQEHKKRFLRGVPERGNMTMFDLIYYNPEHGQRMSIEEEDQETVEQEKVDSPGSDTAAAAVVDAEPDTPPATVEGGEGEVGLPCPQVKIGANGEIILDDSSLVLETTDAKKAKDFMESAPVAVVENNKNMATNYGTWSKKRKHVDWSQKETLRFYKALSVVGSDFSMMESIFKNRTRRELKLKFKKEERLNGKMVDKCLRERGMYTELEDLMQDSEEDSEVEEVERGRRKVAKKRPRGRYRNMGYYDSSSGGEEADAEASRSPARKKAREGARSRRRPTTAPVAPPPSKSAAAVPAAAPHLAPAALSGVQFPPGLLAANPGLVGARPGSLVVVASPSKTDPGSQLLHVYMVSSRQEGEGRSRSPRVAPSSPHRSPSPRLTLDPAVVRAVDRARVAGREGRSRANSECESSSTAVAPPRARGGAPRQRTCSEGSGGLRTELVRQRFLSGSARSVPGIVPVPESVPHPGAGEGEGASPGLPVARKSKPDASQELPSTSKELPSTSRELPSTSQGTPSTSHSPP